MIVLSVWSMGPLGPPVWVPATFDLPQGSVLGPFSIIIIYTADLGPLLAALAVLSQSYADDVQAYVHCLASDTAAAVRAMDALVTWMSSNRLRLNPSKTQFIWLGTRQQLAKINLADLAIEFPNFLSLPLFAILASLLIKNLPLPATSMSSAVTAFTS